MKSLIPRVVDTCIAHKRLLRERWRVFAISHQRLVDRRMLLLASQFAPEISGGVYRPAALAKYATQSGWNVTVVTRAATAIPSDAGLALLDYVGPDVQIERFFPSSLSPFYRLFSQIDGDMLGALDMVDKARGCFNADLPHNIVATGPPFSSFVAGYLLARRSDIRLTIEYRDEWTECPFDFVAKGGDNRAWELRCLARANLIIVTTKSQKKHLIHTFGNSIGAKCVVVPNGWEPADKQCLSTESVRCDSRVVLTFAGRLGGHTDPGRFLDALLVILKRRPELRQRLRFRFVGEKHSDVLKRLQAFPYQEVIELVPLVPLTEARRLMCESDALMLFHDPRFERYLPGKLYDYAASATPVLLIDDNGESARLLRELELGWVVSSRDVDALEAVFSQIGDRGAVISTEHNHSSERLTWLESHTRERLTHQFLDLLLE